MSCSKEILDTLFEELDKTYSPDNSEDKIIEYIPEGAEHTAPAYTATSKTAGPQPLSIERYRERNKGKNQTQEDSNKTKLTRRKRGGKAVKLRQQKAELYRIINITTDRKLKNILIKKLHILNKDGTAQFERSNKQQPKQ